MFRVGVHRLQIIQGRCCIRQFALTLVIFALTAPDTAEVKAQNGEAHIVEGVMQIIDHTVVHCAAKLRMRMQDDGNRGILCLLWMITAFKPPFWALEYHLGHVVPLVAFWRMRVMLDLRNRPT